jgi:23S rRNA (cytosine1962-C5)-methyltransferase
MFLSDQWRDYELIDAGGGEKLERWGDVILQRPDPQAIWPRGIWEIPHAVYHRNNSGGGYWEKKRPFPNKWLIDYQSVAGDLTFIIEPTSFKHTGLFPEQATNWDFCADRIQKAVTLGRKPRILNLFAYTGGATVACAAAGAVEVVHVDASKGMNSRARENLEASKLSDRMVRCLTDDVIKFVERETRRGRTYDGVIMDPPSYGRGPGGELWKLEDALYELLEKTSDLVSEEPLFFLINSYTTGLAPTVIANMLNLALRPKHGGQSNAEELCLPASKRPLLLPCGCTGRWTP